MSVAGLCVVYIYIWLGLEQGSGRANRKWCACWGAVSGQQVVVGEGVYKYGAVGARPAIPPTPGAAASPKHVITSHAT